MGSDFLLHANVLQIKYTVVLSIILNITLHRKRKITPSNKILNEIKNKKEVNYTNAHRIIFMLWSALAIRFVNSSINQTYDGHMMKLVLL